MKFLLFILLLPSLGFAKETLEARTPLSFSGWEKLQKMVDPKVKKRVDYYLEAYDGENYLLGSSKKPIKLRLKSDAKKAKLQISIKDNQSEISSRCGHAIIFASKKESLQEKYPKKLKGTFESEFGAILNILSNPSPILKEKLKSLEKRLLPYLGKNYEIIKEIAGDKVFYFSPTQYSQKKIQKRLYQIQNKGEVEVSIREVIDYDLQDAPHFSYELELEPESPELWTLDELATYACKRLGLEQFSLNDFQNQRYQRKAQTLQQLRRANSFLGF